MSTLTPTFVEVHEKAAPGWLERIVAMFTATAPAMANKIDPIEDFVQANGGVLTDQLERDISRRFGSIVGG